MERDLIRLFTKHASMMPPERKKIKESIVCNSKQENLSMNNVCRN